MSSCYSFSCFGLFKKEQKQLEITAPIASRAHFSSAPHPQYVTTITRQPSTHKSPRLFNNNSSSQQDDMIYPLPISPPPRYDASFSHMARKPNSFEEQQLDSSNWPSSSPRPRVSGEKSIAKTPLPPMPEQMNLDTTPRIQKIFRIFQGSPKEEQITFAPAQRPVAPEPKSLNAVEKFSRRLTRRWNTPTTLPTIASETSLPPVPSLKTASNATDEQYLAKQIQRNNASAFNPSVLGNNNGLGQCLTTRAAIERKNAVRTRPNREVSVYSMDMGEGSYSPLEINTFAAAECSKAGDDKDEIMEVSPQDASMDDSSRWTRHNVYGLADKDQAWML